MRYEYHELANLFPLVEGAEFDELVADVKANGLHDQIDIYQGKILDGRNRYRACEAAGIEIENRHLRFFRPEFNGHPVAYVLSKNLKRRHLDESQRAMVAARLANMRQGERTDLPAEPSANLPKVNQPAAAKALSISERALRSAKMVQDRGAPELVRAVDRGRLAVSVAARAARLSPETQRHIAERAEAGDANAARTAVKREARDLREADLGRRQLALPDKRYGLIYADPEWRFEPYSRETGLDRAADNHYETSETADICKRPVGTISADDCVLFLWATAPMLPDALAVMGAWGFAYKSHLIWKKLRSGAGRGFGYWFTGEHELLLVGTRGRLPAPSTALCASVIEAPWQGRHSAKPEIFAELIERAFPTLPKIELNRRGPARPGWDAWGNEAAPAESYPEHSAQVIAPNAPHESSLLNQTEDGIPEFLRHNESESTPEEIAARMKHLAEEMFP